MLSVSLLTQFTLIWTVQFSKKSQNNLFARLEKNNVLCCVTEDKQNLLNAESRNVNRF